MQLLRLSKNDIELMFGLSLWDFISCARVFESHLTNTKTVFVYVYIYRLRAKLNEQDRHEQRQQRQAIN